MKNLVDGNDASVYTSTTNAVYNSTYGGMNIYPSTYGSESQYSYSSGIYWIIQENTFANTEFTLLFESLNIRIIHYSSNDVGANMGLVHTSENKMIGLSLLKTEVGDAATVLNTWYKCAWSFSPTTQKYYVGGTLKCTKTGTYSFDSTQKLKLTIGRQRDGRSSYYNNTVFRNIKCFNRILTVDEIKQEQEIT